MQNKSPPLTMDAVYTKPGYLFRRMQQIAVAIFVEECRAYDLTPVQYAALVAIRTHPGIDATQLSEIIYFDRSTIGDVLYRIETKGWIVRESTTDDRRIKLLSLSAAGQEVLKEVEAGIRRVQKRLLAPLTETEGKALVRLLAKIADAADTEGKED